MLSGNTRRSRNEIGRVGSNKIDGDYNGGSSGAGGRGVRSADSYGYESEILGGDQNDGRGD